VRGGAREPAPAIATNPETHAPARETGTAYGKNQAVERAARRLRGSADCGKR
jgi:hypothetical protein